ncbi:hypothetical protein OIY81_3390 [Cryptosporidium canis]|nr:hypothetical protein OIY81_3390 [Cryptosporidium canis]
MGPRAPRAARALWPLGAPESLWEPGSPWEPLGAPGSLGAPESLWGPGSLEAWEPLRVSGGLGAGSPWEQRAQKDKARKQDGSDILRRLGDYLLMIGGKRHLVTLMPISAGRGAGKVPEALELKVLKLDAIFLEEELVVGSDVQVALWHIIKGGDGGLDVGDLLGDDEDAGEHLKHREDLGHIGLLEAVERGSEVGVLQSLLEVALGLVALDDPGDGLGEALVQDLGQRPGCDLVALDGYQNDNEAVGDEGDARGQDDVAGEGAAVGELVHDGLLHQSGVGVVLHAHPANQDGDGSHLEWWEGSRAVCQWLLRHVGYRVKELHGVLKGDLLHEELVVQTLHEDVQEVVGVEGSEVPLDQTVNRRRQHQRRVHGLHELGIRLLLQSLAQSHEGAVLRGDDLGNDLDVLVKVVVAGVQPQERVLGEPPGDREGVPVKGGGRQIVGGRHHDQVNLKWIRDRVVEGLRRDELDVGPQSVGVAQGLVDLHVEQSGHEPDLGGGQGLEGHGPGDGDSLACVLEVLVVDVQGVVERDHLVEDGLGDEGRQTDGADQLAVWQSQPEDLVRVDWLQGVQVLGEDVSDLEDLESDVGVGLHGDGVDVVLVRDRQGDHGGLETHLGQKVLHVRAAELGVHAGGENVLRGLGQREVRADVVLGCLGEGHRRGGELLVKDPLDLGENPVAHDGLLEQVEVRDHRVDDHRDVALARLGEVQLQVHHNVVVLGIKVDGSLGRELVHEEEVVDTASVLGREDAHDEQVGVGGHRPDVVRDERDVDPQDVAREVVPHDHAAVQVLDGLGGSLRQTHIQRPLNLGLASQLSLCQAGKHL